MGFTYNLFKIDEKITWELAIPENNKENLQLRDFADQFYGNNTFIPLGIVGQKHEWLNSYTENEIQFLNF